jgi:hypothetical protein
LAADRCIVHGVVGLPLVELENAVIPTSGGRETWFSVMCASSYQDIALQ